MAAFIAAQRDQHQVPHAVSCRALGVSQSWFYKWLQHCRAGTLPPRQERRRRLAAEIARLSAWIEDYNHHRRHSACQKMSPVAYEQLLAQSTKEAA